MSRLITEDILEEYKEVLRCLGVRRNLIGRIIRLIQERAEEVKVRSSIEISPDPRDEPFCLCGEQSKADFIVALNASDFPQERLSGAEAFVGVNVHSVPSEREPG